LKERYEKEREKHEKETFIYPQQKVTSEKEFKISPPTCYLMKGGMGGGGGSLGVGITIFLSVG
jgi:hypothetical protein